MANILAGVIVSTGFFTILLDWIFARDQQSVMTVGIAEAGVPGIIIYIMGFATRHLWGNNDK